MKPDNILIKRTVLNRSIKKFLAKGDSKDGSVTPRLGKSLSSGCLGNHVSEHGEHGSTSVVEFGIELAGLDFGVLDVFTEPSNSVVSVVLGCRHPGQFDESEKDKDLGKSSGGDSGKTSEDLSSYARSVNVRELKVAALGDVSIEDNSVSVDNLSNKGNHADTSVLALDGTTTFEGLGLGIEPSEGIVDSERLGDTKLKFVHVEGGGGLGSLGRRKGGGTGDEEGCNGKFHVEVYLQSS